VRTAEGALRGALSQVRSAQQPFRSSLMSFLDDNNEVLERLVSGMYVRGRLYAISRRQPVTATNVNDRPPAAIQRETVSTAS
jgi:hypothetical protein